MNNVIHFWINGVIEVKVTEAGILLFVFTNVVYWTWKARANSRSKLEDR